MAAYMMKNSSIWRALIWQQKQVKHSWPDIRVAQLCSHAQPQEVTLESSLEDVEYKANNHLLVSSDGKLSLPRRSECIRYLSSASLRKDSYIQIASEVIVCPITFTNGSYLLIISGRQSDYISGETRRDTVDESLNHDDFFGVSKLFTRTELFESRVHLGHKEGLLDQRMKKYMIGTRREQCIMDLDQTTPLLNSALNFTANIAYRNGIILFVNRVPQFAHAVEEMARACGEYAHTRHWQKGCFTNAQIQMGPGTRLPDLIVFLNTLNDVFSQHQAVIDAAKMNIPTIAIVDSNCNPNLITYPVPGNDDTPVAVELFMRLFKESVLLGKQKKQLEETPV